MRKILLVARRDFLATVSTKGFIIAVMLPRRSVFSAFFLFPRLMNNRMPAVSGQVAVIDQTVKVAGDIRRYLSREANRCASQRLVQPVLAVESDRGRVPRRVRLRWRRPPSEKCLTSKSWNVRRRRWTKKRVC